MSRDIIIPIPTYPAFNELAAAARRAQEAHEIFKNSPLFKVNDEFLRTAKSMHEKLSATAAIAARTSGAVAEMESIFNNSAVAQMQRNSEALRQALQQFRSPAVDSFRSILEGLPRFIFQPQQVFAPAPKTTYQQPGIDLPRFVVRGKKAELHFDGRVVQLGKTTTQVAKAAQYICDNIESEIDVAMLHIHCHDPERGKYTSSSKNLTMEDRYRRGAAMISDLYNKDGFGDVFYLDAYWNSRKRKFTPILKK